MVASLLCVCVCVCVCVFALYLCHTLFDYAEGTVCSPQTGLRCVCVYVCVCVCILSISVPYIFSSPSLSLWFTHIHNSHTQTYTRFDRVTGDTVRVDTSFALSGRGCAGMTHFWI